MPPCSPLRRSFGSGRFVTFAMLLLAGGVGTAPACSGSPGPSTSTGTGGGAGQPGSGGAGGGDAGGGAGGAPNANAVAKAISDFTSAFCTAARTCCAPVPGASGLLANCETTLPSTSTRYAAIVAGTVVPDLTLMPACIAALQQAAATCLVPDACLNVWKGTKSSGDSCALVQECIEYSGPALCYRVADPNGPPMFTGVCKPAVLGTVGTPCVASCGPGLDCSQPLYAAATAPMALCRTDDGLYCESAACAPLVAPGAPCTVDPECGTESYCATTCTPRKLAGESCLHDNECSQLNHLYCVQDVCSANSLANDQVCNGDLF